jgi:6-pyruvoyltetrahydropterin/6-carboxytetrahydropterin synthase
MTYQVEIRVTFRAGHRLLEPYKGKCNNVHGEGYTAIIIFEKEKIDENGMVFDFSEIKKTVKEWIDDNWDHAYIHGSKDVVADLLNDMGLKTFNLIKNPTAENMAICLYDIIRYKQLPVVKVGIIESFEDNIAWYEVNQN